MPVPQVAETIPGTLTATLGAGALARSRGAFVAWAGLVALVATAASLSYGISPLYSSNQNQYFLHGLARAGVGWLRDDWLAKTADPTPVFSTLVAITQRYLHPALFYVEYVLLVGVYFTALISITLSVVDLTNVRGKLVAYLAVLLGMHSALLANLSLEMIGLDVRAVLTNGVAGQYILGPYLQPSAFGVLLMASVALFRGGRARLAAIVAALAAVVHPTYLLSAALLVCAYMLVTFKETRSPGPALWIGLAALAPVLPILGYVYLTFRPSSPESVALAQSILVHDRLPHHLLIEWWLIFPAYVQIALVIGGIVAVRRAPRLFPVLLVCAAAVAVLTAVQALSGSLGLALVFPWRLSVVLVPICSSVLAARVVSWIWDRRVAGRGNRERILVLGSAVTVLLLAVAGALSTRLASEDNAVDSSVPMMNFVRETRARGDLYFIPLSLERFRLYTATPVFVDRKSIPYRDVEVVQWRERFTAGRAVDLLNDPALSCEAVGRLAAQWGLTHAVLRRGTSDGRCPVLQRLYEDRDYGVYRVVRR